MRGSKKIKFVKILTLVAGMILILAITAWFLRNTLIQKISNPLLGEYGISVNSVSLDALATDNASIGYLELMHEKGTTISIDDLQLPIGESTDSTKRFAAKKVSIITSTRTEGEPFEIAKLIEQITSLHSNLGNTELLIAELDVSSYPSISNLAWSISADMQTLKLSVASIPMSISIFQAGDGTHKIEYSLPYLGGQESIVADIEYDSEVLTISGGAPLELAAWEKITKLIGIVPNEIDIQSGSASLSFAVNIPFDATLDATATARLAPSSPVRIEYFDGTDNSASILANTAQAFEVQSTILVPDWSLKQPRVSIVISYGEWIDIPMTIDGLSCQSGPSCTMKSTVVIDQTSLPIGDVGRLEIESVQTIDFSTAGIRADIYPGATLDIRNFKRSDTKIEGLSSELVSDSKIELTDDGWRINADSLDVAIESMAVTDEASFTMTIFLEKFLLADSDDIYSVSSGIFSPKSELTLGNMIISSPGFKGRISQRNSDISIDLDTVGLQQEGAISAKHNLENGDGMFQLTNATSSFSEQALSSRVSPWVHDADLVSGDISVSAEAAWTGDESGFSVNGSISLSASELAGYYTETAFAGLSTPLHFRLRPDEVTLEPSTMIIKVIDSGLPIENIQAGYELDLARIGIAFKDLEMTAFGGRITADPFSFYTDRDSNTLTLHADSIELDELLTIKEFEAIEVSGSVKAMIPITVERNTVSIANGTMTGEAPGGVIRYLPGAAIDIDGASSLDLVTKALSNFEYESLTSNVSLNKQGDLMLQLQLKGKNPDLDENRPVVLNLGVENNIPQMLKSLRAARAVEEILENRLEN